jgi:hypothetical protein
VGPDRVIRTSPVPDAQRSMETITPRYLRMGTNLPFHSGCGGGCHCDCG